MDEDPPADSEDVYTLLCVRADGVAPVVDVAALSGSPQVRARALALLKEHASCQKVEVWRDGVLVDQFDRA